jgi:RNA polymerase sigma-70 factor (ECF subfamily)
MSGDARTDEALFAAYIAGDRASFATLVRRLTPTVRRIVWRGDPDEADELTQEVFLRLHRSAADFRYGEQVRPWLVTIALNLRRERSRQAARRHRLAPVDHGYELDRAPDAERRPEPALAVHTALRALPDAQREVIELHWIGGLPFSEVSRAIGVSVAAVKVRAHRGYQAMRILLSGGDRSGGSDVR